MEKKTEKKNAIKGQLHVAFSLNQQQLVNLVNDLDSVS